MSAVFNVTDRDGHKVLDEPTISYIQTVIRQLLLHWIINCQWLNSVKMEFLRIELMTADAGGGGLLLPGDAQHGGHRAVRGVHVDRAHGHRPPGPARSEERRVGKECLL